MKTVARFFARAFFKVFPFLKTVIKPVSIDEVSGLTKIKVADSENFSLDRKADIYGKFHSDFNQDAYTAVIPELYIYSLPRGIVKNGLEEIFTKDKKVIKEITTQDVNPQIGQIFPCNPVKRIHGSVAYFNLSSLEKCYGHFWCEYIGQIYLLYKSKIKPDYYVFTQNLPFQKQFISKLCEIFDIPKDKILDFPKGTIIKPDTLIFTSLINSRKWVTCGSKSGWNKVYMPHFIKDLYKMLADSVTANTEYGEKIYVSREKWSFRKTTNEKEVQDLVSRYGFVTIHSEDFDLEEIISIFKNAKYVIAVNGSGIAPFYVTQKEQPKLFLLYPEFFPDTHFKILSSICGIDFNFVRCSSVPEEGKHPNEDDLTVDLKGLKVFLDSLS